MDKWEYCTEFVWANAESKDVKEYFKTRYPNWKNPPKFAPESMEPHLNQMGEAGWEVVTMQPVWPGDNSDVHNYGDGFVYTHIYFCVLKRRKPA